MRDLRSTGGEAQGKDDRVAIIGMACRTPAGSTVEKFWESLKSGVDAIGVAPPRLGKASLRGGFLNDVENFDASFFGIDGKEAESIDPQQRLTLEVAWEALESSGILPQNLSESDVGVFLGNMGSDYSQACGAGERGYWSVGLAASVISGRLSYSLDLHGPAVTVDTACSSSLVAIHLACSSLRSAECSMALAGGVQLMSTPGTFRDTEQEILRARDGRCKAFSAEADGVGWSEGVGVLVLKRLSDAIGDNDPVLAVIAGTAINQDGRSQGLTAPHGPSQERVLKKALEVAGLSGAEIDAVEAHGTGTRLGDPIEAEALTAVYGPGRDRPLWLGSLKSNIGHTQAAAGVLSVIKMVLALRHELLPPTLHVKNPNPWLDWEGGLTLLREAVPWKRSEGRARRAGISSFGLSGTNAHLILEEPPTRETTTAPKEAPSILPILLSGKTAEALLENAHRLAEHLEAFPRFPYSDLSYSLASTRTAFACRHSLLVSQDDASFLELRAKLKNLEPGPENKPGRLAILFSGQGSQRPGMGLELLGKPGLEVFTEVYSSLLESCDAHLPRSLREVIETGDGLNDTGNTQPGLFCLETALFRQWQAWGIKPDVLLGHSIGELVAAHVAGVLETDDAVRLVCARGRLMQELANPGGAMLSVAVSESQALEVLSKWPKAQRTRVELAAVNSPSQLVFSGDAQAIDQLAAAFAEGNVRSQRLQVSHAFHSAHMDPMLEAFAEVASRLVYGTPSIPILSNRTGEIAEKMDAEYWVRQIRETVRFGTGLSTAQEMGVTTFLECGPGAALSLLVDGGIPSLGKDQLGRLMSAAGKLHDRHQKVDWPAFFAPFGASRIDLPTYAFQRQRYWLGAPGVATSSLCYQERWKPLVQGNPAAPTFDHCWLVSLSPREDWLEALSRSGVSGHHLSLEKALEQLPSAPSELTLLYFADPQEQATQTALRLAQALLAKQGFQGRLWLLTPQSLAIGGSVAVTPSLQALWGFGRALSLEQPRLFGGLLDLPAEPTSEALDLVLPYLLQVAPAYDELAYREGKLWTRLLQRSPLDAAKTSSWRPSGPILITGGTGHLGSLLAHWLVEQGAQELVLASRRGLSAPGALELVGALQAKGCQVVVLANDLSDEGAVEQLLSEHRELKGVFHLAGAASTTPLSELTPQRLEQEMAAKVRGAWNLHRGLERQEIALEIFVLYGSIAGFWGAGGQLAYSAANAALNGLAEQRLSQGLAATIVHWGRWPEGGMVTPEGVDYLARRGIMVLQAELALRSLGQALSQGLSSVVVATIDWKRFAQSFSSARIRPLLAELSEAQEALAGKPEDELSGRLARELSSLEKSQRFPWLLELVCQEISQVLGLEKARDVPIERPLQEFGLDSLTAVELRNRLVTLTGLSLHSTLAFDYPTPEKIASHIMTAFQPSDAESAERSRLHQKLSAIPLTELHRSGLFQAIMSWQPTGRSEPMDPPSGNDLDEVVNFLRGLLDGKEDGLKQ